VLIRVQERCEGALLQDFLILPVQRAPRYLLLLKAISKVTDDKDPAFAPLQTALDQIGQVASEINGAFAVRDRQRRVVQIHSYFDGDENFLSTFVTPGRGHIFDGALRLRDIIASGPPETLGVWNGGENQQYWLFLFNDWLVITFLPRNSLGMRIQYKSGVHEENLKRAFKIKYARSLIGLTVVGGAPNTTTFSLQEHPRDTALTFIWEAETVEERASWVQAFNAQISASTKNLASLKK
jgi:hypothetical protein